MLLLYCVNILPVSPCLFQFGVTRCRVVLLNSQLVKCGSQTGVLIVSVRIVIVTLSESLVFPLLSLSHCKYFCFIKSLIELCPFVIMV